ncbi:alpha-N-acetylglucosaminidase TIM-barrel domain-containing protein [Candidatus Allofournierella merdipullorum]|uniref:alpha-N-acetylglucosaminidase TIM-barrel domain-containing protein n=1 Tax=Candidatus Allofournierella merdipullorum TaxID=2838595 RepID=UPI002A90211D|nr:alpha-N-acetylglucosaminidase TIM-barrel domain-containing protein [Candidatus Fournierella merdipullorum]
MRILQAEHAPKAYDIAAAEFCRLYAAVTGSRVTSGENSKEDLVVIGADDVNSFARNAFLEGWLPEWGFAPGSDGYAILSVQREGRTILFLAGGRGRSTLYAVYDFFYLQAGCRYFWDGDIIPQMDRIPMEGLCIRTKPDFQLRGLRYFAHRGLHRFQAEHWGLEDWKREIDWIMKRRLNMIMLRVGAEDLFQQAFPEFVSYPNAQGTLPEAGDGYDDRTLFWSLQYRGWLHRQVLRYAAERDLIQPEDCGTTTHWYTRTPLDFLSNRNPAFIPQVTEVYRQPTGLVWDIRQDSALDDYFRLTKTHAAMNGGPRLFHTIGLAERMCSDDRATNMRFKRMAYHRILARVERDWPGARVLIASWDFAMCWEPEEVKALIRELDPARHIIFDYTADTIDPENGFWNWGLQGRYPWVFGIFHAFEPCTDLRGDYETLARRIDSAREDGMCRGLALWPELSHSDILMLEFFVRSAWCRQDPSSFLASFCQDRYRSAAAGMEAAWKAFWPLLPLRVWELDRDDALEQPHQEYFFNPCGITCLHAWETGKWERWAQQAARLPSTLAAAVQTLRALCSLDASVWEDPMSRRDCVDLARSALCRVLNQQFLSLVCGARHGEWSDEEYGHFSAGLDALADLLDSHEDYSQRLTLERLRKEHPVNDSFEPTLKRNLANGYCRSAASEFFRFLCVPENHLYFSWAKRTAHGEQAQWPQEQASELMRRYLSQPFSAMRVADPPSPFQATAHALATLESCFRKECECP